MTYVVHHHACRMVPNWSPHRTYCSAEEAQINELLGADRAVLLVTVGGGTSFPTAAHLASYASLAPTTKAVGHIDPRRTRAQKRQPAAQTRDVPLRVRCPEWASTTPAAGPVARPTHRPFSASPANASASCSPCSATEPSTNHASPTRPQHDQLGLDEEHRGPQNLSKRSSWPPTVATLITFTARRRKRVPGDRSCASAVLLSTCEPMPSRY